MNIFRLAGDMSHLLAILLLIAKIWKSKSVAGLSGKSQVEKHFNLVAKISTDFILRCLPNPIFGPSDQFCVRLQYSHENRVHYLLNCNLFLHLQ